MTEPLFELVSARELFALLPGPYYMDPPDGGDVPLVEQLRRMSVDAARYRWLRGGKARTTGRPRTGRIEIFQWDDSSEGYAIKGDALDAAIDAARSQEPKP